MRARRSAAVLAVAAATLFALVAAPGRRAEALGAERPPQLCTRTLVVPRTDGAGGCWIDEHVTRQPGTLSLPCDGKDGAAEAVFGDRHFTGTVASGRVHLVLHTQFHFSDGCNWGTTQTIDGALAGGHLGYGYQEFPLPGQTGCASACRATGDVQVR